MPTSTPLPDDHRRPLARLVRQVDEAVERAEREGTEVLMAGIVDSLS